MSQLRVLCRRLMCRTRVPLSAPALYVRALLPLLPRFYSASAPTASTSAGSASSASSGTGSYVLRTNIGLFGEMNAGKSTLMNALTQQYTSIVDATPGTTADVKTALLELHAVGPTKLLDTAGLDEGGLLGSKKKSKTVAAFRESDVAILLLNPLQKTQLYRSFLGSQAAPLVGSEVLKTELELVDFWRRKYAEGEKELLVVLNLFTDELRKWGGNERKLQEDVIRALGVAEERVLSVDLNAAGAGNTVTDFIQSHLVKKKVEVDLLPRGYVGKDSLVLLNIPMDAETPEGRLLRPQAMVQEYCLRHFVSSLCFRMDLSAARDAHDSKRVAAERERFRSFVQLLFQPTSPAAPRLVVTDSQAMDCVYPWTKDIDVDITTFSIAMINFQSGGRLQLFVEGLKALKDLRPGDKVLISEACNHNRITSVCEDIGTVQIPKKLKSMLGGQLEIEHAFGREFPELGLKNYKLVIHCGGCMIDRQKMRGRIEDCEENGVPITNYGLLLSYFQSPDALKRVLKPWDLDTVL